MTLPVIADVFRVTWNFGSNSGLSLPPAHNVTHYLAPGKTASQCGAALLANRVNAMFQYLSTLYQLNSCDVLKLDGSSSTVTQLFPAGVNGQASGDLLPQVCGILTFQTAFRGSTGRGRLYQGPSGEAAWTAGFVSSSANQATWGTAWNTFNANMLAAGFDAVVASYKHTTYNSVVNVRANPYSATQRRRMERLTR